jgi:hypothetical protein
MAILMLCLTCCMFSWEVSMQARNPFILESYKLKENGYETTKPTLRYYLYTCLQGLQKA